MKINRLDFIETTAFMERKRTIDKVNEIIDTINESPIYTDDYYNKDEIDSLIDKDVKCYDITNEFSIHSVNGLMTTKTFNKNDVLVFDIRNSNDVNIIKAVFSPILENGYNIAYTVNTFTPSSSDKRLAFKSLNQNKNDSGIVFSIIETLMNFNDTLVITNSYFEPSLEKSKIYLYRVV